MEEPVDRLCAPRHAEDWRKLDAATLDSPLQAQAEAMRERHGLSVSKRTFAGVPCFVVSPPRMTLKDQPQLVLAIHGGAFVMGRGEAGLFDAILIAALAGFEVISVDYRMPPDHPFPAAIDDLMAVWISLANSRHSGEIAVFGGSAGAALALSLVQRALRERQPVPGALVAGSPWADLSKTGDSYQTNAGVDRLLGGNDGFLEAAANLYANGRELTDPLLSPIYGTFRGFPPTFLVSGTRDLFLSNTVRVHHRLVSAGARAELHVEEAQSHSEYLFAAYAGAPEGADLFSRIARFLNTHLTNSSREVGIQLV